ncbi:MAG: hypothetical protein ACP5D2_02665 [Candidatus Nanoarchaeia archaeon]
MKIRLIDIIIIILSLLLVYFILTRIFGNSASDLTIMVTLFLVFAGLLYRLNKEFGEFRIKSINSLDQIKKDICLIKEKV